MYDQRGRDHARDEKARTRAGPPSLRHEQRFPGGGPALEHSIFILFCRVRFGQEPVEEPVEEGGEIVADGGCLFVFPLLRVRSKPLELAPYSNHM